MKITRKQNKIKPKTKSKALNIILLVLVFFAVLAYSTAIWYKNKYGEIGFDSIIFTLFSALNGVENGLVIDYFCNTLFTALLAAALFSFVFLFDSDSGIYIQFGNKKSLKLYPFSRAVRTVVCLAFFAFFTFKASNASGLTTYIKDSLTDIGFYEEEYVYPDETELVFPEQKRNLIYIYLESMETTFFADWQGGAYKENVIPELYTIADENVNFSETGGVGDCRQAGGATWTAGAMVAHTAGIPLKLPPGIDVNTYGIYGKFLPGTVSLMDILKENGYYQALVIGSSAQFGGRDNYYYQHGIDEIFDFISAPSDGIIPDGYNNYWWGMEDLYVYDYAKQCLTEKADDGPFAISILTSDTHFPNGFVCPLCQDGYTDQYQTVYSCASRQLNDFLEWLKQQDFYDNTAIIIAGDHCSMDNDYMSNTLGIMGERRIYNCFVNSAVEPQNEKYREFSQFDMFPSTLAAMGVEIKGDRLGLGVNLFSGEQTLAEKYGFDVFNSLIQKKSNMYEYEFLYDQMNIG